MERRPVNRRDFLFGSLTLALSAKPHLRQVNYRTDIAVIGGGVGGFAATLAALQSGSRVVLTEETDWIGGQLTAQAIPPDEHPWIEDFGCTGSYRLYRNAVRDYYRNHYPLTPSARARQRLNPGNGMVSKLTHEFQVSVAVLEEMLAPYVTSGQLVVLLEHTPISAGTHRDRVNQVAVRDLKTGLDRTITARYFIDATELGDLLPLTGTEFITGSEARSQTGEMHATEKAEPANNQCFTYSFALDHLEGEDHTIDRPADYARWRSYVPALSPPWTGKLFSWTALNPQAMKPEERWLSPNPAADKTTWSNLWLYRRIADRSNFRAGAYASDITLVNWLQNDFWLGDILTVDAETRQRRLDAAKQQSLSLLYWMQTEAPRLDGGTGFSGLRLRPDVMGTSDGLAKAAYIRESRRIRAEFTITEAHVGTQMRMQETGAALDRVRAQTFADTVGIGAYRIDLHPSAAGTNIIDVSSLAFQIPLGALLPVRVDNLLPACKNIGTTHITNGCYREHPTEWGIGEAAGTLAAYAIANNVPPREVGTNKKHLRGLQAALRKRHVQLEWPANIHSVEWT